MTAEELEKKIKDEYGNMTGKNLAALVDDKVWELVKASPYLNYQENDQNKNDPYSLAIRSITIDGDTEAKLKAYEALIEIYKKTGYATDHRDAYNQKILQANKDALEQLLNDTSDSTISALNKIVSVRDSLTTKLTDFNKTFEKVTETVPETVAVAGKITITTAEHDEETYKMGADSIEDNIRILEDYGDIGRCFWFVHAWNKRY